MITTIIIISRVYNFFESLLCLPGISKYLWYASLQTTKNRKKAVHNTPPEKPLLTLKCQ